VAAQRLGDGDEVVTVDAGHAHGVVERAGHQRGAYRLWQVAQRRLELGGGLVRLQLDLDHRFDGAAERDRVERGADVADRAVGLQATEAFGHGVGRQVHRVGQFAEGQAPVMCQQAEDRVVDLVHDCTLRCACRAWQITTPESEAAAVGKSAP
jgi:hypothetical protein